MNRTELARRLPVGAELQQGGGADVRVWAPAVRKMDLVIPGERGDRVISMQAEPDGYFRAFDAEARVNGRYWFRLDGPSTELGAGDRLRPDPASRWQPDGPHKPSAYVDPRAFPWTDAAWSGLSRDGQIVYELHVG